MDHDDIRHHCHYCGTPVADLTPLCMPCTESMERMAWRKPAFSVNTNQVIIPHELVPYLYRILNEIHR